MLISLLAAIVCSPVLVNDPLEVPAQAATGESAVEIGAHVTPLLFRASNFSDVNQILVFGAEGVAQPVYVLLAPGQVVGYECTPEALAIVRFEVVSLRPGAWKTSGWNPLALQGGADDQTLWTQPGLTRVHTWLQSGCEVSLLVPGGSLLPEGLLDEGNTSEAVLAPTHVPVITPTGQHGNLPPDLEDDPLPPV